MSGTVLSFISVYLLVAYAQMWRDKGLILRAGLICALMKSISPSAIIIGPMTGIFAEALLLELSVALFGRNMVGYIIGGSLAVFSALAHKAVSLLIYYGFDFVNMLSLMYSFAAKQLKLAHMGNPEFALLFLSLIYLFAGAVAAILGKRLGMKSHLLEQSSMPLDIKFEQKKELNDLSNGLMVLKSSTSTSTPSSSSSLAASTDRLTIYEVAATVTSLPVFRIIPLPICTS